MRTCKKCGEAKEDKDFYFQKKENRYHCYCRVCHNRLLVEKGIKRKIQLIELMGGKCQKCGYDKNYAALEFHHLDPNEKEFVWTRMRLKSWEVILEEIKKCILLCANCHREFHNPQAFFSKIDRENLYKENIEKEVNANAKGLKETGKCLNCDNPVYGTTYCSNACRGEATSKVKSEDRPTKKQLEKMLETMSWCAIGRKYNVSDNAVRKWAKKLGILPDKNT